MKNLLLFISVAVLVIINSSCSKETISGGNDKTNNKLKTEDVWTQYLDGIQVTSIDSSQRPDETFIDGSSNTIYMFSTDSLYRKWAENQNYTINGHKLDLVTILANADSIEEYALNTQADTYFDQTGLVSDDMLSFMEAHGVKNDPSEQDFRQLYDNINYINCIHTSALVPIPSLGSARNRAESFKIWGVGITAHCDKRWFGKPRTWVVTVGYFAVPDLGNWNNRIESIATW